MQSPQRGAGHSISALLVAATPLQMGRLVATSPRVSRLLRGRLHSSATASTSHRLSSWLLGWCRDHSKHFLRREPCASGPHATCWGLIPSQGRLCAQPVPRPCSQAMLPSLTWTHTCRNRESREGQRLTFKLSFLVTGVGIFLIQ